MRHRHNVKRPIPSQLSLSTSLLSLEADVLEPAEFAACPNKFCPSQQGGAPFLYVKNGTYTRLSDHRRVQTYQCKCCGKRFSQATLAPEYNQKKRQINPLLLEMLGSATSLRRASLSLHTTRKTLGRKLRFLSNICHEKNQELLASHGPIGSVQFDEMETFEHTKCKPVAIALAVEKGSRLILGAEVASMPANGHLAKLAFSKYGHRPNGRRAALERLLGKMKPLLQDQVVIESDMCPLYPRAVQRVLGKEPALEVTHLSHKGKRGCLTGQGELKKLANDPLFSLNHTAAMLRANINRLFRRTWNSTKQMARLLDHIRIYAYFHNQVLLGTPAKGY